MPDETQNAIQRLMDRNHELEVRYTHLQRTVEVLNDVVIQQGRQIDLLETKLTTFSKQVSSLADRDYVPPSLEEEKPPHY